MVPLYFISKFYNDFKLVSISSSIKNREILYKVGKAVREICESESRKIVLIASCDIEGSKELSDEHEKMCKRKINRKLLESVNKINMFRNNDFNSEVIIKSQKYGFNHVSFILGAINGREIKGKLLSYENVFGLEYCVMEFKTV